MGSKVILQIVSAGAAWLLLLAAGGLLVAGLRGGLGVLAGGAVAFGNFWLLARGTQRSLVLFAGRGVHPLWVVSLAVRYLGLLTVLVLLLRSDWVHPLALIAGLSVLPPVLITYGLRSVREIS